MLPLVALTQAEVDAVVATVPGGAPNVQDIYPLAPLQEGILFHHLMAPDDDPYLLSNMMAFDSRELLDAYLGALQSVIDRHDILRTAIVWQGVSEAVQVVWRHAPFVVEEVELDPSDGRLTRQLTARFGPRRMRLDITRPPLVRGYIAHEPAHANGTGRWLLLLLQHHLIGDQATLTVTHDEVTANLAGNADKLPVPLPFRNLVAQARRAGSREEHDAFFRNLLGDVIEPTAPFGLLKMDADASVSRGTATVDADVTRRLHACAQSLAVGVASICHVAWALVLARISGREDVV
ncbi:MAG: condensation domain-containing protein, partial [Gemmatimonadaceae bacterium]